MMVSLDFWGNLLVVYWGFKVCSDVLPEVLWMDRLYRRVEYGTVVEIMMMMMVMA